MRRLALILIFLASNAQAAPVTVHCQRYESKCTGAKCYTIADGLKEDTKKEVLTLQKMDKVDYMVQNNTGTEIAAVENADNPGKVEKYVTTFGTLNLDEDKTVMSNKNDAGAVREEITIDNHNGFYTRYLIHTDGSIKDVPIGEPYKAFFGWCEEERAASTEAAPIPATSR
jgi:hypothetical protein